MGVLMRRLKALREKVVYLTALGWLLTGCAGLAPYQKAAWTGGDGYVERAEMSPGAFEVRYVASGRTTAFVRYAAYYRAAELAYESGYRYFLPLKEEDITKKPEKWNGRAASDPVPGVALHIQCYRAKPGFATYDSNQYLNQAKIPGMNITYSINMRQGDQITGNKSIP